MVADPSVSKQLRQNWAWVLDASVLSCLATIVLLTASRHEPWADEADTWLEVRDIPFIRILLSELRYDGHLPLWHFIVWIPVHLFHMPYAYFVFIGATCAIGGLAVLVFLAPFPRPLRYLIAGSFFFLYQYAVVARPYVLMPLLGFLAAHYYRLGLCWIYAFAITIAILIQDSTYAAVIGIAFSTFYAFELLHGWKETSDSDRRRVFRAGTLIASSLILAVIVLFPRSDSSLFAEAVHPTLARHLQLVGEGLTGAFAATALPAIPLLVLSCIWAYQRGGVLLFLLAVGGTSLEYGFIRGYGHHQGLITIAFVVFLWAAWPTTEQLRHLPKFSKLLHQGMLLSLLLTFGWHCTWSYKAVRGDIRGPYSGALDAARFLKSVHADQMGCGGYLFWSVAVQPYFDHNIFLNYGPPNASAAYHFSTGFIKRSDLLMASEALNGPPFIVVAAEFENPQQALPLIESYKEVNYILVHFSDGTRFFKGTPGVHSSYFVFEKLDFALTRQKP